MICNNCGTANNEDAKFCKNCGNNLAQGETTQPEQTTQQAHIKLKLKLSSNSISSM
ncbi:MAG: zinc-ribbon domain-containing protein [Clostridia bacterium]